MRWSPKKKAIYAEAMPDIRNKILNDQQGKTTESSET